MRSDFPRTTQQSFIIYSKLERDSSDELIIPSGPMSWQVAAFTSETGFATAAGAYESAVVDITPVLTDGVLSFEVSGKQQGVYHSGTFQLTLTTVGDAEADIEPASATFTIPVVVFGKADLLGHNRTLTCYVGEYVEPFSIVPTAINPIIDYGGSTGALKDVTRQYNSGLSVSAETDLLGKVTDIKLGGRAARPGVYLAMVFANQWTEGGQYDNLPSTFDRGNGYVPFIVTILDHDHADGNLMVSAKATVGPAAHYRVVMLTATVEAFASAEYLYNCEMTQASSILWSGSYSDDKGEYTITYEYQLRLDGDTWKLEGREIDSRSEDPPPAFDLYDSSAKRLPEQDVPHVNGWANVGIQGLTEFALRAREFPDDPWVLFGFFNHLAPSVWEQQPMYCPQFEGLVTAPAVQFDGGYIYSEDEEITNDFEGFLVKKEFIAHVVTPYAPPASEKYTYTTIPEEGDPETITRPVRDVAARIGNVPHSLAGDRPGNVGVPGGDPWGYWAGARRITPKNGTSGDIVTTETMGCSYSHVVSHDYRKKNYYDTSQPQSGEDASAESNISWSGEFSLDKGQERNADRILLAIGMIVGDSNLSRTYTSTTSQWNTDTGYIYSDTTEVTKENNGDGVSLSQGAVYVSSGPMSGLCKHEAVATGWAGVYIDGTEDIHTVRTIIQTGLPDNVTTTDTTAPLNQSAYYLANSLAVVSGDTITIVGYKRITKILSATSAKNWQYEYMDDPWSESGVGSCEATHSSVQEIINGVNIGSGTTYSKFIINGVETEETVSDPDGSIYASLLDSFIDIEIPPPGPGLIYATFQNIYDKYSDVETIEFA